MSDSEDKNSLEYESLSKRIESLESRLSKIESILRIEWEGKIREPGVVESHEGRYSAESTESKIVEYGLAWLGSIVFIFGIIFLMTYMESLGYPVFSKAVAYLLTFSLLWFAYFTRNSIPILSYVLNICSSLLFYFITLRLHYFSEQPLIPQALSLFLVLAIISAILINAIRKNAEFIAVIAIILIITTAIISDSTYITFSLLILTALITNLLFSSRDWWRLHIFSLFVVYITHLIWFLNNPVMGHPIRVVESPQHNILFLFGYAIIYSLSVSVPKEKHESEGELISLTIWNALGIAFLMLLIVPAFYIETYTWIFAAIALYCFLFAVLLKLRFERKFAPATYASISFMAFSIAVFGYFGLPNTFFLLALQSLLVVSIALWFKSRIIVVANSFLFVSILLIYMIISESIDLINFAFAFSALAGARILGWQKERLTLKTEFLRNTYLGIAFILILYSLNHYLPVHYVTLSWIATAIGFFLLSILLRNIKYRYLAILTIIVTAGHLFFIDLGQMEILYRVIAFLLFAVISIGLSLYYTKRIRKK